MTPVTIDNCTNKKYYIVYVDNVVKHLVRKKGNKLDDLVEKCEKLYNTTNIIVLKGGGRLIWKNIKSSKVG